MIAAKLIEISAKMLKTLSDNDIRIDDFKYLDLYSDYQRMRDSGDKMTYIAEVLSQKYGIGVASVYRVLNRLNKTIKA